VTRFATYILSAKSSGSLLHKNPVSPFTTVSFGPPLFTAITGVCKIKIALMFHTIGSDQMIIDQAPRKVTPSFRSSSRRIGTTSLCWGGAMLPATFSRRFSSGSQSAATLLFSATSGTFPAPSLSPRWPLFDENFSCDIAAFKQEIVLGCESKSRALIQWRKTQSYTLGCVGTSQTVENRYI